MFIIIAGPTGAGKSEVAVEVARKIGGEVVSADSMQVYKGMDIGTYKITKEEQKGVPHHMLSIIPPEQDFSVARYKRQAEKIMKTISKNKKIPVIAGGTGLYIHAIIKGLFDSRETDPKLKEHLVHVMNEKGLPHLYAMLKQKDPEEARVIDKNNPRRVIRALEVIMSQGKKISELKKKTKDTVYNDSYRFFVLKIDKEKLYAKIDSRVDAMIAGGLIEEVKKLKKKGVDLDSTSMQAIGYKEIVDYIKGKQSKNNAIAAIKQNTRRYAKRQVTWLKKYKEAIIIDMSKKGVKGAVTEIIKVLGDSNR